MAPAETPILEEEEEVRLWHLVKSSEEPDAPRRSSMRERERARENRIHT